MVKHPWVAYGWTGVQAHLAFRICRVRTPLGPEALMGQALELQTIHTGVPCPLPLAVGR